MTSLKDQQPTKQKTTQIKTNENRKKKKKDISLVNFKLVTNLPDQGWATEQVATSYSYKAWSIGDSY